MADSLFQQLNKLFDKQLSPIREELTGVDPRLGTLPQPLVRIVDRPPHYENKVEA